MDRHHAIQTASTPEQVADETTPPKRRRRKRTVRATLERRINAKARDRQALWAGCGVDDPEASPASLTEGLDELFTDLRVDRRQAYATGQEAEGTPYRGTTARATR